ALRNWPRAGVAAAAPLVRAVARKRRRFIFGSAAGEDVGWMEFGGDFGFEFGDGLEGLDLFVGVFAEAAEAAVALLVGGDGFEEMDAAEVRPEAVGDEDFGVGDLP